MSPLTICNYLTDLRIAEKNQVMTKNVSNLNVQTLLNMNTSVSRKRRIRSAIRKYARFLVVQGIIPNVPATIDAVDMPQVIKSMPRITRAVTSKHLLRLVGNKQVALMISLLATTGCRISSLADLEISDFGIKSITFRKCKGRKFYVSILTNETKELFNEVRDRRTSGPVFLNRFKKKATVDSLRMKMMKALGPNYANPHSFRHGIATELIERGLSLLVVKEFMNHTSSSITEQYVHLAEGYMYDKVADKHPMLSD